MKKLAGLALILTMVLVIGSVCFAENETDIPDQRLPAGTLTYEDPTTEIEDQFIPLGGSGSSAEETIVDEEVAKDLPKTGGIPAEAFYGVGGVFVVAALVLSRKKAA